MPDRVDANQKEIVESLRAMGASVQHLHTVGKGCPDILVGYRGKNYLFEIKDPDKPPSDRRLSKDQNYWHFAWRGQVNIIHDAAQAIAIMQRR